MKKTCNRCGKEMGLFERSYPGKTDKVNLHYDVLCNNCHEELGLLSAKMEAMAEALNTSLRGEDDTLDLTSVDVDGLISQGVAAVFAVDQHFPAPEGDFNRYYFDEETASADPDRMLAEIVWGILSVGFTANLNRENLNGREKFVGYMTHNTLFVESVEMNIEDDRERSTCTLFLGRRGLAALETSTGNVTHVEIPPDYVIDYGIEAGRGDESKITFKNLVYAEDDQRMISLWLKNETMVNRIGMMVQGLNAVTKKKEDRLTRDLLTTLKEKTNRDLKKLRPGEAIYTIPLDCVLLFLVKNFRTAVSPEEQLQLKPQEILATMVYNDYRPNAKSAKLITQGAIEEYLANSTIYAEELGVCYGSEEEELGWAYYTRRGYIVGFELSRRIMFVYEDIFPNNIYFPYRTQSNTQVDTLQLPLEKRIDRPAGDWLTFIEAEPKYLKAMAAFFDKNNLYYQMAKYVKLEDDLAEDEPAQKEIKRVADLMFRDFGYLPFCLYREWFGFEKALRAKDPLLARMIPDRKPRYGEEQHPYFSQKLLEVFVNGAAELRRELHLPTESIARAMLYTHFTEHLKTTAAAEWRRLGGDIAYLADNTYLAFLKYIRGERLQPDVKYYFGLFIYYLMDKGIMRDENFLNNYDKAIDTYFECKRELKHSEDKAEPKFIFEEILAESGDED